MAERNLIVFLHGMTVTSKPLYHEDEYNALELALHARPRLADIDILRIEWGHEPPDGLDVLDPDERVTRAERHIRANTRYADIHAHPTADDHFLGILDHEISPLRMATNPIKDNVMTLGLTDAIYYIAPDGERAVRSKVYRRLLEYLEKYRDAERVRLHVCSQSLGSTVSFDFLFGLFAHPSYYPTGTPDYAREHAGEASAEQYLVWRHRAQEGRLILGSRADTGSQLALMMMRKQRVVDRMAQGLLLNPTVIGVPRRGAARWRSFFDVDDVLGFAVRRLFDAEGTIHDHQVDTSWKPQEAHACYWMNRDVQNAIADLIEANLDAAPVTPEPDTEPSPV